MAFANSRLFASIAAATLAALGGFAGCHLALGLETAETVDPVEKCDSIAECDDGNPCTEDSCQETCINLPLSGVDAPAELQTAGDCARISCFSGATQSVQDDSDIPNDESDCTTDSCVNGTPTNEILAGGMPCNQNGGQVCDGAGLCVECHSNQQCNAPDTCGGNGTANVCGCTPTQSCVVEGLTCGFIADQTCGGSIPCNNSMQDGSETDVDCGGNVNTCSLRCAEGQACLLDSDCASGNCANGIICAP